MLKDWGRRNRAKLRISEKKWRDKNPDKVRLQKKREYQKNRVAHRMTAKLKYPGRKDKIVEANKVWRLANPNKVTAQVTRRRALKLNADTGTVTADAIKELKDLYNGVCAYCGKDNGKTIDHIVPLARGGKHDVSNLTMCCQTCNSRKCTMLLNEFIEYCKTFKHPLNLHPALKIQ